MMMDGVAGASSSSSMAAADSSDPSARPGSSTPSRSAPRSATARSSSSWHPGPPTSTARGSPPRPHSTLQAVAKAASIIALEKFKISADRYMKERNSIAVIGLSVHTAPVEMREKLAVAEELWPRAIQELTNLNHIEEAAVLSTCNRMEIHVVALSWNRGIREVIDWMSKKSGIPASELREHLFMLRDSDATRYLFEVPAGLDSLVLGEGQILAQVKQVIRSVQNSGGLGKNIDRMQSQLVSVSDVRPTYHPVRFLSVQLQLNWP